MSDIQPHEHHEQHEHGHAHEHGHDHQHGGAGPAGIVADVSVRSARPNDAPAVAIVQAAVFREAYSDRLPAEVVAEFRPEGFSKAWRDSLLAPPAGIHRLLVACAGEQVIGMAALGPSQDPDADTAWGEITVLGVHPDARRVGHGSRLLNAAVDVLRGAGADAVAVWVTADDEATRSFLVTSGFGPDGAFRDRIVSPEGDTLREVRLAVSLAEPRE